MDMDERQVLAHRDRILSAVFDLTRLAESLGAGTREQGAESGDTTRVDGWDPPEPVSPGAGSDDLIQPVVPTSRYDARPHLPGVADHNRSASPGAWLEGSGAGLNR
jgi:hypothetical protein